MKKALVIFISCLTFCSLIYLSCAEESDDKKPAPPEGRSTNNETNNGSTNGEDSETEDGCRSGAETSIASDAPAWIKNNFKCVTVTVSGSNLVFNTKDLPNYKSHYYGSSDAWYEAMPSGQSANPNKIKAQNYIVTIPASPAANATTTATAMDLVGIAVNGVAIYNNAAAPGDVLANEFVTFDAGNSHPTQSGSYHYHSEPLKITDNGDELVGIMRDGFPIYGKKDEDGTVPDDLDEAHGHEHATTLFPNGIYHYHVTDDDPYIIEVYRGTPGTMSNN